MSVRELANSREVGTEVRRALPPDWAFIEDLRRKEGDALGFIPKARYLSILELRQKNGRKRWLYEDLLLATDNGEPTGFTYVAYGLRGSYAALHQVVVRQDARRWHRARLLVGFAEAEAIARGCAGAKARVAADLEANLFWCAMGFRVEGEERATLLNRAAARSGRLLHLYRKEFVAALQPRLWVPE